MKSITFIDTHSHINLIIKKEFDTFLTPEQLANAHKEVVEAQKAGVNFLINVGTSLIESQNCVALAQQYANIFAVVGIHPNDCSATWRDDFVKIKQLVREKEKNKIVGIGECGIDRHYPDYNIQRQYDAFRAHIELALEHNLALVIHSRDAYDETLKIVDEYRSELHNAIMHCFSYDLPFAKQVVERGFSLGIGGTVTYPKNSVLRTVVQQIPLTHLVLETDAPYLPPQQFRGTQNHPKYIKLIAEYIAELKNSSIEQIAYATTENALRHFKIDHSIPEIHGEPVPLK
jgi:TatD DNase family protein